MAYFDMKCKDALKNNNDEFSDMIDKLLNNNESSFKFGCHEVFDRLTGIYWMEERVPYEYIEVLDVIYDCITGAKIDEETGEIIYRESNQYIDKYRYIFFVLDKLFINYLKERKAEKMQAYKEYEIYKRCSEEIQIFNNKVKRIDMFIYVTSDFIKTGKYFRHVLKSEEMSSKINEFEEMRKAKNNHKTLMADIMNELIYSPDLPFYKSNVHDITKNNMIF